MGNKRKRQSFDEKLEKYKAKIRKIERRKEKENRPTTPPAPAILSSKSDDSSSDEICSNEDARCQTPHIYEGETSPHGEQPLTQEPVSLSTDVLGALGDVLPEQPKFSPKICEDVARILNTILKCGLKKEAKTALMEDLVPENCSLLIAPKMNMDIINTVGDKIHNRDKKIESEQNQLGVGLSMLCKILALLTVSETVDRLKLISSICNAVRILADLHAIQTRARKNLTLPNLDKSFLALVKDVQRDEYLFGNDLHQKIAAMTTSQRNAKAIGKKQHPQPKNYSAPTRYQGHGLKVARNGPQKPPARNQYHQYHNQYQNQQRFPKRTYPPPGPSKPHVPTHK